MFAMGPAFFRQASAYAPLAITGAFAAATVGVAYSSSIPISGGLEPYSLTGGTGIVSGALDSGFSLAITGAAGARFLTLSCASPATADTMTFTASVDSSDGQTAASAQSVTVTAISYAAEVAADAPLLWYRLNGTAVNNGTVPNLGSFTDSTATTDGKYHLSTPDQSLQPGSPIVTGDTASLRTATANSWVECGSTAGSNMGTTTQYTVEAWFTAATSSGYQELVSMDNATRTFQLRINNNKLELVHINGAIVTIASAATVTGGSKHQAAATLAPGGVLTLYLDGAQVATATNASMVAVMKNNAFLANYNSTNYQLVGNLAEVSIYGVALSAARILAHWNAGK